ncbi:MAG: 4-hydroxy-tetrahydrodipicolinate synthase [Firmicutes bacterium]|nr:4-hydroxy-tetrahydrodipicolinate synthase [Bacillota bacterium]
MNSGFGTVITAMITPMLDDYSVDYQGAAELAEHLIENGSDGLVVAGTTGESPTLSDEEKVKLFATVVESVGGKVPVIAGTGSNNTAHTIELTKQAEKVGVDGVMLVTPYYNKPSQGGILQHFKTVVENTRLPVMIYNIPGRTGVNITADTMVELSKLRNVVAIKEASGSLDQIGEVIRRVGRDVKVYSGDDSLTLPVMAIGGDGVVSVASHVVGLRMRAMIDAYNSGRDKEAADLHLEMLPLFKNLFITSNPVPVKTALSMLGLPAGPVRLPLVSATEEEVAIIKQTLQNLNLV